MSTWRESPMPRNQTTAEQTVILRQLEFVVYGDVFMPARWILLASYRVAEHTTGTAAAATSVEIR